MTVRSWIRVATAVAALAASNAAQAQQPPMQPGPAEGPRITALTGLSVPQFETEMRHFVQALGVNCGGCHARGNFASEDNPRKAVARRMIEMTKALNKQAFAAYVPAEGESCFTCHQGELAPKMAAPPAQ
jgi:photosynthetic reaction center cytochrome c subunit